MPDLDLNQLRTRWRRRYPLAIPLHTDIDALCGEVERLKAVLYLASAHFAQAEREDLTQITFSQPGDSEALQRIVAQHLLPAQHLIDCALYGTTGSPPIPQTPKEA